MTIDPIASPDETPVTSESAASRHGANAAHPERVLFEGQRRPLQLPVCDHYAGNPRFLAKALDLRLRLGPLFDITLDLEDGASVGQEMQAALWAVACCRDDSPDARGLGVRIHDVDHAAFEQDLNILLARPTPALSYLMLPKASSAEDVSHAAFEIDYRCQQNGWEKAPPLHVLIETPGAVLDVERIAGLGQVESLSFGVMDYVSHFNGAIPETAMRSPLQFEHPLLVKARVEMAMACHRFGKVPSHNVCTQFKNVEQLKSDALRARTEFGFTRMWSIHPDQIEPIISAFAPDADSIEKACAILLKAHSADWGPIEHEGQLHDRASFRFYWHIAQQAYGAGCELPITVQQWLTAE